jgi:hypothetical protein
MSKRAKNNAKAHLSSSQVEELEELLSQLTRKEHVRRALIDVLGMKSKNVDEGSINELKSRFIREAQDLHSFAKLSRDLERFVERCNGSKEREREKRKAVQQRVAQTRAANEALLQLPRPLYVISEDTLLIPLDWDLSTGQIHFEAFSTHYNRHTLTPVGYDFESNMNFMDFAESKFLTAVATSSEESPWSLPNWNGSTISVSGQEFHRRCNGFAGVYVNSWLHFVDGFIVEAVLEHLIHDVAKIAALQYLLSPNQLRLYELLKK